MVFLFVSVCFVLFMFLIFPVSSEAQIRSPLGRLRNPRLVQARDSELRGRTAEAEALDGPSRLARTQLAEAGGLGRAESGRNGRAFITCPRGSSLGPMAAAAEAEIKHGL